MIRKIHLGKCLNEGDWDAVRKDMNLRPVEGVSGLNTDEEILAVIEKIRHLRTGSDLMGYRQAVA